MNCDGGIKNISYRVQLNIANDAKGVFFLPVVPSPHIYMKMVGIKEADELFVMLMEMYMANLYILAQDIKKQNANVRDVFEKKWASFVWASKHIKGYERVCDIYEGEGNLAEHLSNSFRNERGAGAKAENIVHATHMNKL